MRLNGLLAKVDTLKEFGVVVENFFTLTSNHWITSDKELNNLKGRIFTVTIVSAEITTLRGFGDLHRQHTYKVESKAALVGKRMRQKRLRTTVSKHGRIKDGHLPEINDYMDRALYTQLS